MARWIVGGRVVKKSVSFAEQLRSGRNEKIRGVGRVCFSVFFFFPSFFHCSEKFLREVSPCGPRASDEISCFCFRS